MGNYSGVGREMSGFGSVTRGFVAMVICIFVGLILSLVGGTLMTKMNDISPNNAIDSAFQGHQDAKRIQSIFVFWQYVTPCLGIGIFIIAILSRYDQDRATDIYMQGRRRRW
jgi:hypothetical protein